MSQEAPARSPGLHALGGLDITEDSLAYAVLGGSVGSQDDKYDHLWAKPYDGTDSLGQQQSLEPQQAEEEEEVGRARAMSVPRTCAICLDGLSADAAKLKECEHSFCFDCIKHWAGVTNKCPLCKAVFSQIQRLDGTVTEDVEDRVQVATASGMRSYTVEDTTNMGNALERSLQGLEEMFQHMPARRGSTRRS